jgi:hypothetical protein
MNWILEHIQLVILVGGAVAYWLNQRRKAKEEAEAEAEQRGMVTPPPTQAHAPVDAEAERVRRIQEEIRRKILERAGGGVPKPQPPPMLAREIQREVVPEPSPALARTPSGPDAYVQASSTDQTMTLDQAVLERQQQLAEQLRELDAQRRHVVSKAEAFAEKTAAVMAASDTAIRGSLLADLRNPALARRAIVLREVLGTPVGLR